MASSVVGQLRVLLNADTAEFETSLAKAKSSLNKFAGVAKQVGMVAGAAAAAGLAAVSLAVVRAAGEMDKLGKSAQSLGLAVDELGRLKYAAERSGVGVEQLSGAIRQLSRNMATTASGAKNDAARAFTALGVSVKNTDGTLRSSSDVITDIAARFADVDDSAAKTALAVAVFGEQGAALIPMLNEGRQGLADLAEEAEHLGLIIDEQTAEAVARFNDNLGQLRATGEGLVTKITAEMSPTMASFSGVLADAAKNSRLAEVAAGTLTGGLKLLSAAAIGTVTAVRMVGNAFLAMANTVAAVASNNWEGIGDAWGGMAARNRELLEGAGATIEKIWNDTGGRVAASAPKVGAQLALPMREGAKKTKEEVDRYQQELERSLDFFRSSGERHARDVEEHLSRVRRAFFDGKASIEEYRKALTAAVNMRVALKDPKSLADGMRLTTELRGVESLYHLSPAGQAEIEGQVRQMWERGVYDGVRAAMDGDLKGFITWTLKDAVARGVSGSLTSALMGGRGASPGGGMGGMMSGLGAAFMSNPVGWIAGGAMLAASLIRTGKTAKSQAKMAAETAAAEEALTNARQAAEEAARKMQAAEQERADLAIRLLRLQGDEAGALAAERERELAAMDESNRALASAVFAWEDAEAKVTSARAELSAAYEREAGAIEATIDKWSDLSGEMADFGKTLRDMAAALRGPGDLTQVLGSQFASVLTRIRAGDDKAFGELQGVSEDYLAASEKSAKTLLEQQRTLAQVRAAVAEAGTLAGDQVDMASAQLTALNAQVAGLLDINNSVKTVAAAIAGLSAALGVRDAARTAAEAAKSAPAVGGADWAKAGLANPYIAGGMGGQSAILHWRNEPGNFRAEYNNFKNAGATLADLDAYWQLPPGTAEGIARGMGLPAFANGGAFRIAGAGGLDRNLLSINGSPAAWVSRGETVQVDPANSNEALRREVASLRYGIEAIARNTRETASINKRWDGDGLPTERDVA